MPAKEKLTKVRGIPADCVWPGTPGRAFVVTLGSVEARRLASEATLAAERFVDVSAFSSEPRHWPPLDTLSRLASELLCAGAAGALPFEEAADVEAETMGGQCAPDAMQPPVRILRDPQLAKRLENQAATITRLQVHADELRAELRNSELLREKLSAQLDHQTERTALHNERVHQLEAFRVEVVKLAGKMRSASVNQSDAAQNGPMARASWADGRSRSYEHAANALDELLAGAVAS